jgi:hypothetical protein
MARKRGSRLADSAMHPYVLKHPIIERTTRMVRNRRAARAVAIQQESAAQAVAGWLFVAAGLAAVTALAGALSFVLG